MTYPFPPSLVSLWRARLPAPILILVQPPHPRRGAAPARRPASANEQPKSAYARSLLERLDHASEDEQSLLDEAAKLDHERGDPKSSKP